MATASCDVYKTPAVRAPSCAELGDIAKSYGLVMTEDELKEYEEVISKSLGQFDKLEELVEPQLPVKYPRTPGHPPKPADNPYNAWCWRCDIKGVSSGKLAGKTIAIKDNIPIAGVPLRNGCRLYHGYTPDYDATVVTRILDAGGHIIGKVTCEDCCVSGTGFTSMAGPVLNPYDKTRIAGGSSSGSAVAVATGAADMALGTDQGGSIRTPASACGIVGLKPTWGLVPYTGLPAVDVSFDHVGPMTKNVYDCALLLEVLAGYDEGLDPRQSRGLKTQEYTKQLTDDLTGIKIGILQEGFDAPSSEKDIDTIVTDAAKRLTEVGAVVDQVSVPMHKFGNDIWDVFFCLGVKQSVTDVISYGHKGYYPTSYVDAMHSASKARINDTSIEVKEMLLRGEYLRRQYGGRYYAKCQNLTTELKHKYDEVLRNYHCLVMPTLPGKPKQMPPKCTSIKEHLSAMQTLHTNPKAFNMTGHPAITINAGFCEGLPVGMMFVSNLFDEVTLLKVAYAYEQLRDSKMM
ncbi:urethanase-like isoform X2 [Glandiceps talaboti]